jgi:hypothetical protein
LNYLSVTMNSKQKKAKEYHQKTKEWDRKYESLSLDRPQDVEPDLLHRVRQLNFGLLSCSTNPKLEQINDYSPPEGSWIPKLNFKCYPTGRQNAIWVDTTEKFSKMMDRLHSCNEFTIDLEMHNHRTMTGMLITK